MEKKRNLIISVCIKLSRNFEIVDFLREKILSKNLEESQRTGNTFNQLSKDSRKGNLFLKEIQSNLSNTDTEGTERSVRIREVSVV